LTPRCWLVIWRRGNSPLCRSTRRFNGPWILWHSFRIHRRWLLSRHFWRSKRERMCGCTSGWRNWRRPFIHPCHEQERFSKESDIDELIKMKMTTRNPKSPDQLAMRVENIFALKSRRMTMTRMRLEQMKLFVDQWLHDVHFGNRCIKRHEQAYIWSTTNSKPVENRPTCVQRPRAVMLLSGLLLFVCFILTTGAISFRHSHHEHCRE
jgi:hypothetical protein